MFCSKCGVQNAEDSNYCRSCGANLAPLGATGHNIVRGIKPDKYAGFWVRVISFGIDCFVLFVLSVISGISIIIFFDNSPESTEKIYSIVYVFLCIFYEIWMTVRFGQTIGKVIVGIRVVTTHNEFVSYKLSVLRFLGKLINCLTLGIGFIMLFFSPHKRGLHDLIGNTKVVYTK
ncbi:MAG: hypothetical protein A2252_04670 [Elusimicrobia bacterium RIFOXYA2_FULL_39_19]|nr:MAG: hypothetical protein A2252_04670 [Elusimicrobia bacterium RIFOXYA2_FULL_39_19]